MARLWWQAKELWRSLYLLLWLLPNKEGCSKKNAPLKDPWRVHERTLDHTSGVASCMAVQAGRSTNVYGHAVVWLCSIPHRLLSLDAWSPSNGAVWHAPGGCRGGACLEEVRHWRRDLGFDGLVPFPARCPLSACRLWMQRDRLASLSCSRVFPTMMSFICSGPGSQSNPFPLTCFW